MKAKRNDVKKVTSVNEVMKNLGLDGVFDSVFPEVARIEKLEKEKGKITAEDLKKIFG